MGWRICPWNLKLTFDLLPPVQCRSVRVFEGRQTKLDHRNEFRCVRRAPRNGLHKCLAPSGDGARKNYKNNRCRWRNSSAYNATWPRVKTAIDSRVHIIAGSFPPVFRKIDRSSAVGGQLEKSEAPIKIDTATIAVCIERFLAHDRIFLYFYSF